MLAELLHNEITTTLNGAILSGATSITVASTPSHLTASRVPFKIRISGNLTGGGTGVMYRLVTNVNNSTNVWTITTTGETPYDTGLGFATGATVEAVLTSHSIYDALGIVNVCDPRWGGAGDAVRRSSAGSITTGTATLTDAGGSFTRGDIGKMISIAGAGASGATLITTISAVASATSITIAVNASTTATNQTYEYGTDNAAPINNAITYAAALGVTTAGTGATTTGLTGAIVFLPPGVYLHSASIVHKSRTKLWGSGPDTTTLRRVGDYESVQIFGIASGGADSNGHWYGGMENLTIDGNDRWMQGVSMVYARQFRMRNVHFYNIHHIALDIVEVWDSSFTDIFMHFCGGIAVTEQPALYIRSTRAASGFGSGTDSSNELKFTNLHIEHFRAGAVKIAPGFGAALNGPNGIYFTNMKFETAYVSNTTPFVHIAAQTERIHLKNLYSFAASFQDGSAVPIIQNDSVGQTSIRDIYAANAAIATISSAVNMNISGAGMCVCDGVYGSYGTAPTVAHVNVAQAGDMEISNVRTNLGTRIAGYEIDAAERMLVITADATSTITTAANLASMTFSSVPAGTYRIVLEGMYRSSITTGGPAFGVGGTATATGTGTMWYNSTATVTTGVEMTAITTTFRGANAGTAATSFPVRLVFTAVITVAGTIGLRWNMSAAGTMTLRAGAVITLTRIR